MIPDLGRGNDPSNVGVYRAERVVSRLRRLRRRHRVEERRLADVGRAHDPAAPAPPPQERHVAGAHLRRLARHATGMP